MIRRGGDGVAAAHRHKSEKARFHRHLWILGNPGQNATLASVAPRKRVCSAPDQ